MSKVIEQIPAARKALVALAGAVVVALTAFGVVVPEGVSDDVVKVFDLIVGILTVAGVYRVPNDPTA
jgi:hypothetical protein